MLQTESKRESNQRHADTHTSSLSNSKSECGSLSLDLTTLFAKFTPEIRAHRENTERHGY